MAGRRRYFELHERPTGNLEARHALNGMRFEPHVGKRRRCRGGRHRASSSAAHVGLHEPPCYEADQPTLISHGGQFSGGSFDGVGRVADTAGNAV